ncbi:MAG: hypothetical protein DWI26_06445, partial [Planctomycetota bacterium]
FRVHRQHREDYFCDSRIAIWFSVKWSFVGSVLVYHKPGHGQTLADIACQKRRAVSKQVAWQLESDYNEVVFTKDRALQRCNPSVVKSEVGMWSGPLRGSAPFHSDFGTMR